MGEVAGESHPEDSKRHYDGSLGDIEDILRRRPFWEDNLSLGPPHEDARRKKQKVCDQLEVCHALFHVSHELLLNRGLLFNGDG